MNDLNDTNSRKESRRRRRAQQQAASTAGLGALMIPLLALSFVFGKTLAPLTLLLVVAAYMIAAFLNPEIRARLTGFTRTGTPYALMALSIPMLALSGVFGGPFMMTVVILLVGVLGFMLALNSEPQPVSPDWTQTDSPAAQPQSAAPALPVQAQGEKISELDVRALCRGLPPMQAGQIMSAVEELELAMVEAERQGNMKAAFDTRQALTNYLPGTVEAWKAQRPEDQDITELNRALEDVRAIAGSLDGSAQRRAWETQQRFLKSRGPQGESLEAMTPQEQQS